MEVAKLVAGDAAAGDSFGRSVAIDGDTVVVGASGDDDAVSDSGSVYVFRTTDGGATYAQVAKLKASDGYYYDFFGSSVAIAGSTIVVGSRWDDEAGSKSGSAYVFRTSDGGATYGQVAKLTAADAASGDFFGISVAIDGNTIVVGAHYENSKRGAVYVFRTLDGGATYVELAKLTASDAAIYDEFGRSVAIDGDTIVVGAHQYHNDGSGSAYVFRTSDGGATYDEVAKLTASDAAANDQLGISVAIDGNTIVVGADGDDHAGAWSGSAYVFRTTDDGVTYDQVAKLTAADGAAYDNFGDSVAIAGGTVVAGAYGAGTSGAVYVFRTTDGGATYDQVARLTAADASSTDYFGSSVAIAGDRFVVGAHGDDDAGSYSGSAYVFALPPASTATPTSQPTHGPTTTALAVSKAGGSGGGNDNSVMAAGGGGAAGIVLLLAAAAFFHYRRSKGSNTKETARGGVDVELGDVEPEEGDDRPTMLARHEDTSTIVQHGLTLTNALLSAGSGLPLVGELCRAVKGCLGSAVEFGDKADDVLIAAKRVCDVLDAAHLMAKNVARLEDERALVESRMRHLVDLLVEFNDAMRTFGKKGWCAAASTVEASSPARRSSTVLHAGSSAPSRCRATSGR